MNHSVKFADMAGSKAVNTGKRLRELAEAGLTVFCRAGYERCQMADVAKAMGVAVGTVYSYVESKEALFELVIRYSSEDQEGWLDALEIPVKTPPPGATIGFLREVFGATQWPALSAALDQAKAADPKAELEGVLREQYSLMRKHRRGLLLLMKSALEFPGMVEVFVLGLRARLLEGLSRYLHLRVKGGQFRQPDDVFATAAVITQTIAWSNLQRPLDPGLAMVSEEAAETAVVEMLAHGLLN